MQKRIKPVFWILMSILMVSCSGSEKEEISFYVVGHRGARGLIPENTIPSFKKAIEVGANTIEFDVHISKDDQVIIYHDDTFTPAYTTKPDGSEILDEEREQYNFYQMDYADIRQFIIGEKEYPAFPEQQRLKTYVPLLSEMIDSIEQFTRDHNFPATTYLLEIKSNTDTTVYGIDQPRPEEYMAILMNDLDPYLKKLKGRLIIQSFDPRPLQVIREKNPKIPIGLLVGDKEKPISEYLDELGFIPEFYNPHYSFVTEDLMEICQKHQMKILPWTVQEEAEMEELIDLGVNGIISDYPNRVAEVLKVQQ